MIKKNVKNFFVFICPNCGHEFTYKFTDEEIEMAEGLPIEITSVKCDKCGKWISPIKAS